MKRENGFFGKYGGAFVPEELAHVLSDLEEEFYKAMEDKTFLDQVDYYLKEYVGRENPLYFAENLTKELGGGKIYLKREDLNHTGAHKINNVLGQALLAKKMGKKKLIAETGAGQHGVAAATAAVLLNMECEIHMGAVDIEKQALNVYKMRLLGANVVSVDFGLKTLKEAVDSALIAWNNDLDNSFYLIGSAVGPHPYPTMVRDFQKIIGKEIKAQINLSEKRNPDYIIACVGGGSNAIGAFYEFINNKEVNLIGVEAAGEGLNTNKHSAAISLGKKGLLHGMKTKVLLDDDGNIKEVHSIAAGLDYPGVGPEHAYLESIKRVKYVAVTNEDAIEAFKYLSKTEGIIPAIESAHAVAYAIKLVKNLSKDKIVVINLSGRGDKDVKHIAKYLGEEIID